MDKDISNSNKDPPEQSQTDLTQSSMLDPSNISSTLTQSIHPFSPQASDIYNTGMSDSSTLQTLQATGNDDHSEVQQASYITDSNVSQQLREKKEEEEKNTQEWVENLD